jgi:hypothetical protein
MIVLGISGKMGVGKNYVSEKYIIPLLITEFERLGKKVIPYFFSFGSCIKAELYSRDSTKFTYDNLFNDKPGWVRQSLQEYGTKVGREGISSDVWIRQIELWMKIQINGIQKIPNHQEFIPLFILQDLRFTNELEFVRSFPNSLIIRVEAPHRNQERCKKENGNYGTHISETDLDNSVFPFYFFNDIDGGKPHIQAKEIIEKYMKNFD